MPLGWAQARDCAVFDTSWSGQARAKGLALPHGTAGSAPGAVGCWREQHWPVGLLEQPLELRDGAGHQRSPDSERHGLGQGVAQLGHLLHHGPLVAWGQTWHSDLTQPPRAPDTARGPWRPLWDTNAAHPAFRKAAQFHNEIAVWFWTTNVPEKKCNKCSINMEN